MEVHEFGNEHTKKIVLIPGNTMCWRQFESVIPLLAEHYHVAAISTDGYDGTGETTFTTAVNSAEKLEGYIWEHLDGEIDLVFGESFGCATAGMLFHRQQVTVKSMILSGAQYMNIGILNGLFTAIVPRSQFRLLRQVGSVQKLPWMLRLYTRGDDEKLLNQFQYTAKNVSLETLQNCTKEAFALYPTIDRFAPREDAKVAIWYGAQEPNMKKAIAKLKHAFPNAQVHPFPSYGHGDIMAHPDIMAAAVKEFMGK